MQIQTQAIWVGRKPYDKRKNVTKVLLVEINDKVNMGAKRYLGNKQDP